MNLKNSFFFIFIALTIMSCDKQRVFDEYKSVGPEWSKDSVAVFSFDQTDTIKPYNLFLNVRNNDEYEFSNLFLIVSVEQPGGMTKVDTLEYMMANPDGSLLGEGFSSIKENKLVYKKSVKFPKKGTYYVTMRHAVRKKGTISGVQSLKGVTEVGFRIESIE